MLERQENYVKRFSVHLWNCEVSSVAFCYSRQYELCIVMVFIKSMSLFALVKPV